MNHKFDDRLSRFDKGADGRAVGISGSARRPLKMGAHDNEFSTAGKIYGEWGIDT
jgi:hypothetical protein